MLTIREAQMRALQDVRESSFYREIADYLTANYPAAIRNLGHDDLHRTISAAAERAAAYGFHKRCSVAAFVALTFAVGPAFDDHPRISEILGDDRIPADFRMEYLASAISASEWQEAAQLTLSLMAQPA